MQNTRKNTSRVNALRVNTLRANAPSSVAAPATRSLEALLNDLVRAHEVFLRASGVHRESLRRADPSAISEARDQVAEACQRIAALDQERRSIVAALSPGNPDATLTSLAARLPEPERSRSLELATTLRELVICARTDQRRLRAAADSMLRHVRGVVQQVQQSLNHSGTYGRAGRVDAGAAVVSGIDMTT